MSTQQPTPAEAPFNPALITWVEDRDGAHAIITEGNLHGFAMDHGYAITFTRRAYNPLVRAALVQAEERSTAEYFIYGLTGRPEGLLAEHFQQLVDQLVIGELRIPNLGRVAVGLLSEYAEALHQPAPQTEV